MNNFNFEKLEVYQRSALLTNHIYNLTREWSKEYLFDLTSQLRRAALSITLNIVEGSGRSRKDFSRFIDIARGSCLECVALLDIASKQELVSTSQKEKISGELIEISKMLSGLKKALKSS